MNTVFLTLCLIADLSVPFGLIAVLGLAASVAAIGAALRSAPEGYEDQDGFQFKRPPTPVSKSVHVVLLRPHNAG